MYGVVECTAKGPCGHHRVETRRRGDTKPTAIGNKFAALAEEDEDGGWESVWSEVLPEEVEDAGWVPEEDVGMEVEEEVGWKVEEEAGWAVEEEEEESWMQLAARWGRRSHIWSYLR